jgi:hypothetical protein
MGSLPLFDRLLDPEDGGRFVITSVGSFEVDRRYLPNRNVLRTIFFSSASHVGAALRTAAQAPGESLTARACVAAGRKATKHPRNVCFLGSS